MGLMLRVALLIMVGLVVMEMASSGMSNSNEKKGIYFLIRNKCHYPEGQIRLEIYHLGFFILILL